MAKDVFGGVSYTLQALTYAIQKGRRLPAETSGEMDSDVTASIIGAAFHAAGYKTRIKAVRQSGQRTFHHVFVEVYSPTSREWFPVDPQRTEPGDWEEEIVKDVNALPH